MPGVLYFAYGSNMLRERFAGRCGGVELAGLATLPRHCLTFEKVSMDRSGKCAFVAGDADLPGVLWSVPESELLKLDAAEGVGHGYERAWIRVVRKDGRDMHEALTYRATNTQHGLVPYDWYLAVVLAGAMQQGLTAKHVERLRANDWIDDPQPERKSRLEAIQALGRAGMTQMLDELHMDN